MSETSVNQRFRDAAVRALGGEGLDGVEIGTGRKRPTTTEQEVGMVEMVYLLIEAGDVTPPPFLKRPPHLPGTDAELAATLSSKTSKDQIVRADIIAWRDQNLTVEVTHSRNLRTMVEACRKASALRALPDVDCDHIDGMHAAISARVRKIYLADTRDAPGDFELDAWCSTAMRALNPTPDWLAAGKKYRGIFGGRDAAPSEPRVTDTSKLFSFTVKREHANEAEPEESPNVQAE